MNTAKKLLNGFLNADITRANVQLCFACSDKDDTPEFQRVNITRTVANQFRDLVDDWRGKYAGLNDGEISLRPYDAQSVLLQHELEFLSLEKHPEISGQIEDLDDIPAIDEFDSDDSFIDRLRFCVVVIRRRNEDPALLFRFYSKKKELSRSKMFGIFLKDGQYDKLTETTFLFDGNFDCLILGGYAFISNKSGFHSIFRFYEMLMQTAKETLDVIERHIPIANVSDFRSTCMGHLQKVAKLKNIASKPYLSEIKISDIKKAIVKYELPIETVGSGDNKKLKFDASDKWAILRLLDDDYLESIMTGESYEVNSKRQLVE